MAHLSELSKKIKPPLVILPGWGGTKETWADFVREASVYFDVTVLELPCFGDVPCPGTAWGVTEYAAFVIDALEAQKRPVIVLGHSFGGQVAAMVAHKRGDLMTHLVLSAAAVIRPKKLLKRAIFALIASCGRLIIRLPFFASHADRLKAILYRSSDSPDYLDTNGIKRDIFRKVIREDLQYLLPHIAVPTLILWGTRDRYTPLSQGKRIARLLSGSTLQIIKDGTHGLHLSKINDMVHAIRTFVAV